MKDEQLLIEQALSGSETAFEKLVRTYMRDVYYTSLSIVRDHFDADDVTQNTFVRCFTKLGTFNGASSFKTWLLRITINLSRDCLRKRNRTKTIPAGEYVEAASENTPNAEQQMSTFQDSKLIETALDSLSERQRIVVSLRLKQELSFSEIAELLQITTGNAKTTFHYGVKRIIKECERKRFIEEGV
ncbi:MAG: RNA polymerase sigma factor [Deltaproteobacteria bacterium]|nr:RNA polymerase sigma factor [Candidatus Zymogenaceae bacterium]